MRNVLVILIAGLALMAAGCSKSGNKTATSATPESSDTELSEIDPNLKNVGFVRVQLTDPALYNLLESQKTTGFSPGQGTSAEEQKKIGRLANFSKSSKYSLSGQAQITALDKIQVKSFSYNGKCGALDLTLTVSSNTARPLAKVKTIATAVSDQSFELNIPPNISLIQFDSISAVCPDVDQPISTATFS